MGFEVIIMLGYERVDETTPCGGDYSEIYYLDEHNVVAPEDADMCIIRECLSDGTLLKETYGLMRH